MHPPGSGFRSGWHLVTHWVRLMCGPDVPPGSGFGSDWNLVTLWVRLTFSQMYPDNFKTNCIFCDISRLLLDGFSWDFYNRDSFGEMIKMRGKSPILTVKLHVLWNILAPCWWILWDFYNRDSFDEMIQMRGNNPMLTSKWHIFVKYLDPMLMDFHQSSITGIFLMRWLKWEAKMSC